MMAGACICQESDTRHMNQVHREKAHMMSCAMHGANHGLTKELKLAPTLLKDKKKIKKKKMKKANC